MPKDTEPAATDKEREVLASVLTELRRGVPDADGSDFDKAALGRLEKKGFARVSPDGRVTLTDIGRAEARRRPA
jgi:hypothetical protein